MSLLGDTHRVDELSIVVVVLVPVVAGLGLFAAAAAFFTAAVRNSQGEQKSAVVTGGLGLMGGCAGLLGCACLVLSLGAVYCAGMAAPMH